MTTPRRAGRPKDAGKRAAILDAAARLFLEQGYERATVEQIAQQAGVSKLTVYSHFADKEALFVAVIQSKCQQFFAAGGRFEDLAGTEPREALRVIARGFVELLMSDEVVAMHRMMMAAAQGGGETLGRMFYAAGPAPTLASLAALLGEWHRRGLLEVGEPARAADHFLAMLQGATHLQVLLNVAPPPGSRARARHVADCVDTFCRAYAAPPRAPARPRAARA